MLRAERKERSKECDKLKGKYYENKMIEATGRYQPQRSRSPGVTRWPEAPKAEAPNPEVSRQGQAREREQTPEAWAADMKIMIEKHRFKPTRGGLTEEEIRQVWIEREERVQRQKGGQKQRQTQV